MYNYAMLIFFSFSFGLLWWFRQHLEDCLLRITHIALKSYAWVVQHQTKLENLPHDFRLATLAHPLSPCGPTKVVFATTPSIPIRTRPTGLSPI